MRNFFFVRLLCRQQFPSSSFSHVFIIAQNRMKKEIHTSKKQGANKIENTKKKNISVPQTGASETINILQAEDKTHLEVVFNERRFFLLFLCQKQNLNKMFGRRKYFTLNIIYWPRRISFAFILLWVWMKWTLKFPLNIISRFFFLVLILLYFLQRCRRILLKFWNFALLVQWFLISLSMEQCSFRSFLRQCYLTRQSIEKKKYCISKTVFFFRLKCKDEEKKKERKQQEKKNTWT